MSETTPARPNRRRPQKSRGTATATGGINQFMNAVIDTLAAEIPNVGIKLFPDNPANYRMTHSRGELLVSYLGSDWHPAIDINSISQLRNVRFSVTVAARGQPIALDLLELVQIALHGKTIKNCEPAQLTRSHFINQREGIWHYAIDFDCVTLSTAITPHDNSPPLASNGLTSANGA